MIWVVEIRTVGTVTRSGAHRRKQAQRIKRLMASAGSDRTHELRERNRVIKKLGKHHFQRQHWPR